MRNEVSGYSRQNKKPQVKAGTRTQGKAAHIETTFNSTTDVELKEGKARYEKGIELFKQGKVSVTSSGMYKVNGYEVDLRTPVRCECPDYQNGKRACKHVFAALQFSKSSNGGKLENSPTNAPEKPTETPRRDFERNTTQSKDRSEKSPGNAYNKPKMFLASSNSTKEKRTDGIVSEPEHHSGSAKETIKNIIKEAYQEERSRRPIEDKKQATITRLAVLNTATEILKTHDQPIELEEVFFLASRLEAWALGS